MKPHILSPALSLLLFLSCSSGKKSAAALEHEQWIASLADSITLTQKAIADDETEIENLHLRVGELLEAFTHVSNPREVEGYTVFTPLKGQIPLTRTGLAARITESEGFELLAALSGGTFNHVRVVTAEGEATTAVVPHDQALNYRHEGYNTVAFSGVKADSVGRLINAAPQGGVRVEFLGDRGVAGSMTLPVDPQTAISATWQLYDAQSSAERLEREVRLLNRKISLFRMRLDSEPQEDNAR